MNAPTSPRPAGSRPSAAVVVAHRRRTRQSFDVESSPVVRLRRRSKINLRFLIRLAVLCLIVVVILKLLKVI
jgi:hypothetical protein